MKLRTSPDRYSFSMDSYVKKLEADPCDTESALMVEYYSALRVSEAAADAQQSPETSLEVALRTCDSLCARVREDEIYAQNLYAALCNNTWISQTGNRWHASWRRCGGIIAHMREEGDYIDWYCSGIVPFVPDDRLDQEPWSLYLEEGRISDRIRDDIAQLGWSHSPD